MSGAATASRVATVPWACWYGDTQLGLEFPEGFDVDVLGMRDLPGLTPGQVRQAVQHPIGTPRLRDMAAAGPRMVAIAVDDISRPTPVADILPFVLEELAAIAADGIKIIVALGAHRPMIRQELEKKVGSATLRTFDVQQHHPYENLVDVGRSSRGTPVRLNRTFVEADLKIGIGCVLPHPYMGYGGGAKIVVPGLAGIDTLQANHQPAVTGITGGLCNPDVDARKDIEEIALAAGLAFSCNAVVNGNRQIGGLFCGHPVHSHRSAAASCEAAYATSVPAAPYDVLCLNSYPKDTELLQAGNAFNVFRSAGRELLAPGGTVVMTTACPTGRGYHSLHGPGMRLYRSPGVKPFLAGREIVVFSPHLNRRDFEVSFSPDYRFFDDWIALAAYLAQKHLRGARVAVFPHAPLQILQ